MLLKPIPYHPKPHTYSTRQEQVYLNKSDVSPFIPCAFLGSLTNHDLASQSTPPPPPPGWWEPGGEWAWRTKGRGQRRKIFAFRISWLWQGLGTSVGSVGQNLVQGKRVQLLSVWLLTLGHENHRICGGMHAESGLMNTQHGNSLEELICIYLIIQVLKIYVYYLHIYIPVHGK